VERVNRAFCESTLSAHYATLVCGHASPSGEVEICNAGHPPALHARGGAIARLGATGLPVGMFCTERFESCRVALEPGDLLLLYTDGVIEAQDAEGEDYGIDRLEALAAASAANGSRALVDACVRDVARFRATPRAQDDLTVLAIGRT